MGISRIVRLRHPGVLSDFTWTEDLQNFGRYNLIYGWNGSGKTTISKLFRALEMRRTPANAEITLSIDGADVTGSDFGKATLPVHVFNRDFVSESVFPVGGRDVPPILVVGWESVEQQKQVEVLKRDLAEAHATLEAARPGRREAEKALDRHCIDRATVIRDTLRSPGPNPYNNYDKSSFRGRAQRMAAERDKEPVPLADSDREKLLAQHRATPKPKVQYALAATPRGIGTLLGRASA